MPNGIKVVLQFVKGRQVTHELSNQAAAWDFCENRAANQRSELRRIECESLALDWSRDPDEGPDSKWENTY